MPNVKMLCRECYVFHVCLYLHMRLFILVMSTLLWLLLSANIPMYSKKFILFRYFLLLFICKNLFIRIEKLLFFLTLFDEMCEMSYHLTEFRKVIPLSQFFFFANLIVIYSAERLLLIASILEV